MHERTVEIAHRAPIQTDYGEFELVTFINNVDKEYHYALVKGDVRAAEPTFSACTFSHSHARFILCTNRLIQKSGMYAVVWKKIAAEGRGVLVLIHQCETVEELHDSALTMLGMKPLLKTPPPALTYIKLSAWADKFCANSA